MGMTSVSRLVLQDIIYDLLGTKRGDKFYSAGKVNTYLNIAYSALMTEIQLINPSWFTQKVTLAPDSATARTYSLSTQSSPITDFSRALRLRKTDSQGDLLTEVPDEYLEESSSGCFSVVGRDEAVIIETDRGVSAGLPLWLKYEYNATFGPEDADIPLGVPAAYHHVIAFDAARLLFSLGGESVMPKDLQEQAMNDRANLLLKAARRSMEPSTARKYDNGSV